MSAELNALTSCDSQRSKKVTDFAHLNGPQKAAIVVQMILSEGGQMDLSRLAANSQMRLAVSYASLARVNRATLDSVVDELENLLEDDGLEFPNQRKMLAKNMDGLLSPEIASAFRDQMGVPIEGDPWLALETLQPFDIASVLRHENTFVGGLILSKLPPNLASATLLELPEEMAERLMLSLTRSAEIGPDPLHRIGVRLATSGGRRSPQGFDATPVKRFAAILNTAPRRQREALLFAFEASDPEFAAALRAEIFTFANIPARVEGPDIPKVVREAPERAMIQALVSGQTDMQLVVDYFLDNLPRRMADALRDEMVELDGVTEEIGEAAMAQVTAIVRDMADSGAISLRVEAESP